MGKICPLHCYDCITLTGLFTALFEWADSVIDFFHWHVAGVGENGQQVHGGTVSCKGAERERGWKRAGRWVTQAGWKDSWHLQFPAAKLDQENRARLCHWGNISSPRRWQCLTRTSCFEWKTIQVSVSRDTLWYRGAVRCCLSQVLTAGKWCWLKVLACMWPASAHCTPQTDKVFSYTLLWTQVFFNYKKIKLNEIGFD